LKTLLVFFLLSLPLQIGRHFWPDFSIVYGLKVDFLSPVIYLQDLILLPMIFLSGKTIVSFLKSYRKHFFLLFIFIIVNVFLSLNGLVALFFWIRIIELGCLILITAGNTRFIFEKLKVIVPYQIILEGLLGIAQVINKGSLTGLYWFLGERDFSFYSWNIAKAKIFGLTFLRPLGTFSHSNSLAAFIFICLIIVIFKPKKYFPDKIALFLGSILIFLCFSRTVLIAGLLLGLFFLAAKIIFLFKQNLSKFNPPSRNSPIVRLREAETLFRFGRISALTKRIIEIFQPSGRGSFNFNYFVLLILMPVMAFFTTNGYLPFPSLIIRRNLMQFSIDLIKHNLFFGIGANNFILALANGYNNWEWLNWMQPVHNIFLLLISETGLIGFFGFLYLLFLCLRRLIRQNNSNSKHILLISLCFIVFTGMFDHYWFTLIQNQLLFAVILGLSLNIKNAKI